MKRSLHIGINDYPGTGSDLAGCVNDALGWQAALKKRGFEWQDILLNSKAHKKAMTDAITDIIMATEAGDLTVITYSGHGSWVPDTDGDEADGRDEALCPHDMDNSGVITDDYLYGIFIQVAADSQVIFISDSCHSGSVSRHAPRATGPFTAIQSTSKVRYLPPSMHLSEAGIEHALICENKPIVGKSRQTDVVLLAGCKDSEYSYDAVFDGQPAGAFTHVSLWTLSSLPADADYGSWYTQICKYLPHDYYPQTPQLTATDEQRAWKIFSEG